MVHPRVNLYPLPKIAFQATKDRPPTRSLVEDMWFRWKTQTVYQDRLINLFTICTSLYKLVFVLFIGPFGYLCLATVQDEKGLAVDGTIWQSIQNAFFSRGRAFQRSLRETSLSPSLDLTIFIFNNEKSSLFIYYNTHRIPH
jgi:hypothetical protein